MTKKIPVFLFFYYELSCQNNAHFDGRRFPYYMHQRDYHHTVHISKKIKFKKRVPSIPTFLKTKSEN